MAENVEQNLELEKILATLASLPKPDPLPQQLDHQQQGYAPVHGYEGFSTTQHTYPPQQHLPLHQPADPRLTDRPAHVHRQPPPRPQERAATSLIDPSTITEWKQGLRCVSKIAAQNPEFAPSVRKVREPTT